MITVICSICSLELNEPGALLFTSPTKKGMVGKYHFCVKCEKDFAHYITGKMLKVKPDAGFYCKEPGFKGNH